MQLTVNVATRKYQKYEKMFEDNLTNFFKIPQCSHKFHLKAVKNAKYVSCTINSMIDRYKTHGTSNCMIRFAWEINCDWSRRLESSGTIHLNANYCIDLIKNVNEQAMEVHFNWIRVVRKQTNTLTSTVRDFTRYYWKDCYTSTNHIKYESHWRPVTWKHAFWPMSIRMIISKQRENTCVHVHNNVFPS